MSITSYSELQTAAANWLQRSRLVDRIPEFIELAEARFRRKLLDVSQEVVATGTLTGGAATLPTDFGSLIAVRDTAGRMLEQVSASQFESYAQSSSTGFPVIFTIIGNEIKVLPAADTALEIVYRVDIPSLSTTTTTNWLLTRAPDLYLFSTLLQAEVYGWNDERIPMLKAAADEILAELAIDSDRRKFGPAPLAPRIART